MFELLLGMGTGSAIGLFIGAVKDGVILNPIGKFPETFDAIFSENEKVVSNINWEEDSFNRED